MFLKCGDEITRYFQNKVNRRWKINSITYLKNNDVWLNTRKEIGDHICDFLKFLFTSSNPAQPDALLLINGEVETFENKALLAKISMEELNFVVFSMHPYKCPGSDGYTPIFYQQTGIA